MTPRILILALILALSGIGAVGCRRGGAGKTSPQPVTEIIHAAGYLEPRGELRRLSFQTSGIIACVRCEVGAKVRAGDMLARLDDQVEIARLSVAKSRVAGAKAKRELLVAGAHPDGIRSAEALLAEARLERAHLESERDRKESLRGARGISAMEADDALFRAAAAVAREDHAEANLANLRHQVRPEERGLADREVDAAEAELVEAEALLRQKLILAPLDGTIAEVFRHEGEPVSSIAAEPVLLLAPDGPVEVRAEVDERFAARIQAGVAAEVRVRGNGDRFRGTVRAVKPVMGRKTVFTRDATERMDLQIVEVWIELEIPPSLPFGAEVEVCIRPTQ